MCCRRSGPIVSQARSKPMELIYPKDGAKIYVPLEADGSRGRMICNAAHRQVGHKNILAPG